MRGFYPLGEILSAAIARGARARYRPGVQIDPVVFLIMAAAWVLSVGLHEAGHAYAATWLGDPTPEMNGRLTLNPFAHMRPVFTAVILPFAMLLSGQGILGGAWTPIDPSYFRKPLRDHVFVALAGPAVNVLLALFFAGTWLILPASVAPEMSPLWRLASTMVWLNTLLLCFNMLPVPGLDGGYVIRYFLGPFAREKFDAARQYGLIIAIVLLSLPGVRDYFYWPMKHFHLLVFGVLPA